MCGFNQFVVDIIHCLQLNTKSNCLLKLKTHILTLILFVSYYGISKNTGSTFILNLEIKGKDLTSFGGKASCTN